MPVVATTPEKALQQPGLPITQAQKQTLADNLQLEITERARKLRHNYVLMAENLRYRLEMRVNRIPTSLRKVNLQELIERATQQQNAAAARSKEPQSLKRSSEVMTDMEDTKSYDALPNPKKRQKQAPSSHASTASPIRKAVPVTVLSPKSLNSRVIPPSNRTSLKTSPSKNTLPRPISPVKTTTAAALSNGYKTVSKSTKSHGPNAVESANGDIYTIQIDAPAPSASNAKTTAAKSAARAKTTGRAATTTTTAKKSGLKSALASLTSGKRAAAAAAAAARNADAEQSDAASAASVPATSSAGRVLRRRVAG